MRNIALTIVLLAACLPATAQNLEATVRASTHIMEAEVTASRSFWAEGDGSAFGRNIWTESTLAVKTLFKGQADTIRIVTLGGTVGDDMAHVSHGLHLGKGWKGLLFVSPANAEAEKAHGVSGTFRVNELATYYYDLLNPPTVFQGRAIENIEDDVLRPIEKAVGHPRTVRDAAFTRKAPRKPKPAPVSTGQLKVDSLPVITYTFADPQITGTGPFNFEFDLKANADLDSTHFAKAEIWVKYNINAFGANVAGSGNLIFTEENFLATGDYTVTAQDVNSNTVKLTIDYTGNLGQALLNQLPTQPEKLIHIKLPVYDLLQLADLEFKADSMQDKSKFRGKGLLKYRTVFAHDVQVPMAAGGGNQELLFSLENMNVVQDGLGDHWFETDIFARCSYDSAFSTVIDLYLNYEQQVFASMFDPANSELIKAGITDNVNIELTDYLSNPAMGLYGIQVLDTVYFPQLITSIPQDGLFVPSTAALFAKVRLKIANCDSVATVDFNNNEMEDGSVYYQEEGSGIVSHYFDTIQGLNSFSALVCPDSLPVIYSFYPKTITAGTLDTLTILGANLDTAGSLWFRSAEDMVNTVYMKAGLQHEKTWTDSLIRYVVPSAVLDTVPNPDVNRNISAGTGQFYLITNAGDSIGTSGEALTVRYSASNWLSLEYRRRGVLINQDSILNPPGSGGYVFKVNQALLDDQNALDCVEAALRKWRCATGVNCTLELSENLNPVQNDGICTFYKLGHAAFQSLPTTSDSTIGITYSEGSGCYDQSLGTVQLLQIQDIDIAFDSSINWFMDTVNTTVPSMTTDLLSVLIHEVGHGVQLGHTLNAGDVMLPSTTVGQVGRSLSLNDLEGGAYMVSLSVADHSGADTLANSCFSPMIINWDECSPPEALADRPEKQGIVVYPNPNLGNFRIAIDQIDYHSIEIYDLMGRPINFQIRPDRSIALDAPPGVYHIAIHADSGRFTARVVILQ